jgi:hypothetical protein
MKSIQFRSFLKVFLLLESSPAMASGLSELPPYEQKPEGYGPQPAPPA